MQAQEDATSAPLLLSLAEKMTAKALAEMKQPPENEGSDHGLSLQTLQDHC